MGQAKDHSLTNQLIDYLMGENDGIPKVNKGFLLFLNSFTSVRINKSKSRGFLHQTLRLGCFHDDNRQPYCARCDAACSSQIFVLSVHDILPTQLRSVSVLFDVLFGRRRLPLWCPAIDILLVQRLSTDSWTQTLATSKDADKSFFDCFS